MSCVLVTAVDAPPGTAATGVDASTVGVLPGAVAMDALRGRPDRLVGAAIIARFEEVEVEGGQTRVTTLAGHAVKVCRCLVRAVDG